MHECGYSIPCINFGVLRYLLLSVKLSPLSLAAALPRRGPTPSGAVMWQEARKHERKLRGMMVDYKRRGERRREYYEKIVIQNFNPSTILT